MVFFQAEDGIRDIGVTGVQTCALPILAKTAISAAATAATRMRPIASTRFSGRSGPGAPAAIPRPSATPTRYRSSRSTAGEKCSPRPRSVGSRRVDIGAILTALLFLALLVPVVSRRLVERR